VIFATVCSDNYVLLLTKLIKSILHHNENFNYEFYVFHDYTLTDDAKIELIKHYNNFVFKKIDEEEYKKYRKFTRKFYSIESFNIDTDKVIFLDADMICLKNLDELINIDCDFGAVIENRRKCDFNAGMMVIGKKYLNNKTYIDLLTVDHENINRFGNDQKIFNNYFNNEKLTKLNNKFNVLASEVDFVNYNDIVFLHYIYKPNLENGIKQLRPELLKLWNAI
jgi:lipopolysaccharide biosynthesis glycosyltransferase